MTKSEPVYIIKIYPRPTPVEIEIPAQAVAAAVTANKGRGLSKMAAVMDYYHDMLSEYGLDGMDFTYQVREVKTDRIVEAGDDKDFGSGIHSN
jgi:2-oxoglutarate dehydrogenase complex dehydrogenase (E1) component-like enzyme